MKIFDKLWVRIGTAIVFGLFVAAEGSHITYDCAPIDDAIGCIMSTKAITHPNDLLNNEQGGLVRFSVIFVATSATVFILLSVADLALKKFSTKRPSEA